MHYGNLIRQLAGLTLRDPRVLPLLASAAWRFRARDWYRRAPFLPLPPAEYIEWRLHTAYGEAGAGPQSAELLRYLRWADRMKKPRRP